MSEYDDHKGARAKQLHDGPDGLLFDEGCDREDKGGADWRSNCDERDHLHAPPRDVLGNRVATT
jgi:hypothetical protein